MTAETKPGDAPPVDAPAVLELGPDSLSPRFVFVSLGFFAVGLLLLLVSALQLVFPGFLEGIAFLSYGRVYPMATHALIYGWLTIGFLGLAVFAVRRSSGGALVGERSVVGGLGLLAVGYLAGLAGIGAGLSEGRRYVEAPLWADVIVLAGLVIIVAAITRAALRSASTPSQWFLLGAGWWLVFTHVVGNIPGIAGVNAAIQSSFYEASLFGLWFAAAGFGIAYHLVPRISGRDASRPTRLAILGFWSLAFVWASTGPRSLVYGPAPDWLETVGAVFSIGLLVPVAVVFADFVMSMRGRWSAIAEKTTMRFVMTGAALLAGLAMLNLAMALRSGSAVTQFTQWLSAYEDLALLGAFAMFFFGGVYHLLPAALGRGVAPGMARWHYRLSLGGLTLMLVPMLVAGLQLGNTWAAGANDNAYASAGDAFINSVAPFDGAYVLRLVGLVVLVGAQLIFVANVFGRGGAHPEAVSLDDLDLDEDFDQELISDTPITAGRLRFGVVGLFLVAALMVWILPSLERDHSEGTLRGDTVRRYDADSLEARGRLIYLQEGCWYCHTQQVRPIVPDVGLGPVSEPGDYVHEVPALMGVQRIGPDLMHAGSRSPTDSVLWVVEFLEDPGAVHSWTRQPSYAHLSASDLQALATYIAGLD